EVRKQHNWRMGNVETRPVRVWLSYMNLQVAHGFWTWLEGRLFRPQGGLEASPKTVRECVGIPKSLCFKTKVERAWELIEGVISGGLSFELVGFDTRYGRSGWLGGKVRGGGRRYMGEVPVDTPVYLEKPLLGIPERKGQRGRKPSHIQVLSGEAVRADSLRERLTGRLIPVRTL